MTLRRYTLLAEGPSDAALMPILDWLWQTHWPDVIAEGQFADLEYTNVASHRTVDRIIPALDVYPCDVLFVHRDADREPMEVRQKEIQQAAAAAIRPDQILPVICVIPVRMSEAWMLFDAAAIRRAADNPNGTMALPLPGMSRIERLPDPKDTLGKLLRLASGLSQQRLRRFRDSRAARQVTQFIQDFSPLRQLSAFRAMEAEFKAMKT